MADKNLEKSKKPGRLARLFNVVSDPGVGFAIGNALVFWSAGDLAQAITVGALAFALGAKGYSEFSDSRSKALSFLKKDMVAMKVAGLAMFAVTAVALNQELFLSAAISATFGTGNLGVAGKFKNVSPYLEKHFGSVAGKVGRILTQPETYYTAGLGILSFTTGGLLGVGTWLATATGGTLAVKNAILGLPVARHNPMLAFAFGTAATGITGLVQGQWLQGLGNICFSNSYANINILNGGANVFTQVKKAPGKISNLIMS